MAWRSLGINSRQLTVIDRKESFYYFALNQDKSLWLHDVVMFMQEKESIFFYSLKRDLRTTPQVVSIDESISYTLDKNDKDKSFLDIINESFKNQIISTVFLVGDTFAEGWMKQSVALCARADECSWAITSLLREHAMRQPRGIRKQNGLLYIWARMR